MTLVFDLTRMHGPILADHFRRHRAACERTEAAMQASFAAAADVLIESLAGGGTVYFCGNGGSAADAQHLAAELSVRFVRDRPALRSMTLAADSSAMTACGNDFGFEHVFARQLAALGRQGDALVAISTSGNSPNVLAAARLGKTMGLRVVALTGKGGGELAELADVTLAIPAETTAAIQEMHITLGHALCHAIEAALSVRAP